MVQSPPRTNPFPGLRPFELDEEHLFFGREGQADELLTRLRRTRFLAVVGTSGSGKSSLVRAGLLPSLYSGLMQNASSGWRVAILRPGSAPMANLAAALNDPEVFGVDPASDDAVIRTALTESTLRRGALGLVEVTQQARMEPHENLVVVVDQFEELFRFKTQAQGQNRRLEAEDEAAAFVKLLLGAVGQRDVPVFVVLTMRSDFLGDCAQFRDLPETLNDSQYLIPRLTREQLRSVIAGPVAVGGATITPRLVNRLLNDTGDNPDQLPILQHALMRTWDYWEDQGQPERAINIEDYEAVGGMAAALSRHSDQIYDGLPDDRARYIARTLFKRLTDRGPDNRDIRRPTTLAEICSVANASEAEVIAVADEFRGARRSFLMPPARVALRSDTVIDISHESLMRNWQRLGEWVVEETQSALIYKRLAETATMHDQGTAGYWRDPELTIGLTWLKEQQPTKAWAERYAANFDEAVGFLEASAEARDTEAAEKEKSRRREVNRLRTFLALLGGLSLLSGGAAVYAFNQQQEAQNQTQIALIREQEAEEQRDIAERQRQTAEDSRQEANEQKKIALMRAQEAEVAEATAQEQQRAAKAAQTAETMQRQITVGALQRAERGEAEALSQAKKAQEQFILAEQNAKEARSATTRAELEAQRSELQALNFKVQAGAFSVDNLGKSGLHFKALLAGVQLGKEIIKIDNAYDNNFSEIQISSSSPLSPENRLQAVSTLQKAYSEPAILEKNTFRGHSNSVVTSSFSPDGKVIASASFDGTVRLWDLQGENFMTLQVYVGQVRSVSFSPDGKKIAIGGNDGAIIWDFQSQEKISLEGHTGWIWEVGFSPDGKTLASASADSTVKLWDRNGKEIRTFNNHRGGVRSLSFSPDGKTLATGGEDRTIRIWDINGQEISILTGHTNIISGVSFSKEGFLTSSSYDGTAKIWDQQGNEVDTLTGHSRWVLDAKFSPDGKKIATASEDGKVIVWSHQGQKIQTLTGHSGWVWSVNFSADGNQLVTGSSDHNVKLWKIDGREALTLKEHKGQVWDSKFSPDGSMVASASQDGTVKLWKPQGEEIYTLESDGGWAWSVSFSPDGEIIASAHENGTVNLWSRQGQKIKTLIGHTDRVRDVKFSPNGETLASASQDGTVRLWNLQGQELQIINSDSGGVRSIDFSLANTIAIGYDDGKVKLWNSRDSRLSTLGEHPRWIWDVSFSPNGEILASASADGTVRLWNNKGQVLQVLEGHSGGVLGVKFWQNGRAIATASSDGTVKLWDLLGRELQTLETGASFATSIDFSPDSKTLASSDGRLIGDNLYTGEVILWSLNLDDLMAKSCDWLRDYMANPATSTEEKALCEGYLPPALLQSAAPGPRPWVANVRAFLGTALTRP